MRSEYSAFENYMQSILKLLRKKDRPLEQIVCRKTESAQVTCNVSKKAASARFSINYSDGPILRPNCTQYKQACFNDFTLKLDDANNCCCLKMEQLYPLRTLSSKIMLNMLLVLLILI